MSLVDAQEAPYQHDLSQLSLRTLCTNRDLPLQMPVGVSETDFTLEESAPVEAVRCLAGPTRPRPSKSFEKGETTWRLISHLSLNYLSLTDSEKGGAEALRELLSLYSDTNNVLANKQIDGVRSIESKPVTRPISTSGPLSFGRGLEATLTLDESAFEGTGAFLVGRGTQRVFRQVRFDQFLHRNRFSNHRTWRGNAMAREDGTAARPVDATLERLRQDPFRFDFYQAMRLLECAFAESPRYGTARKLSEEPVRLSQEPSLSFSPASLCGFGNAADKRFHKLSVRFFGLCGPNGALPLHLTEYIRERMRHHDDHTLAAFLDIFHHRMLSLFYRAWADAQPTVQFDRPDSDRFSVYVGSLFGMGMPSVRERDEMPDLAKLYYAGSVGLPDAESRRASRDADRFFQTAVRHQRVHRPVDGDTGRLPLSSRRSPRERDARRRLHARLTRLGLPAEVSHHDRARGLGRLCETSSRRR